MFRKFILFFLLPLFILSNTGCGVIKPSWLREENSVVVERSDNEKIDGIEGPTGGHFDDSTGEWIPDKKEISTTYRLPDISSGMLVDFGNIKKVKVSPSLQIELFEVDTHIPYLRTLKLDFGVAYMRTYFYIGKLWTNIFEVSTGAFIGWDFEEKNLSFGLGCTIIRF